MAKQDSDTLQLNKSFTRHLEHLIIRIEMAGPLYESSKHGRPKALVTVASHPTIGWSITRMLCTSSMAICTASPALGSPPLAIR
jgi:hypothetical protein